MVSNPVPENDLVERCVEMDLIARAAQKKCERDLRAIAAKSEVYAFKERLKDARGIHRKVVRKRAEAKAETRSDAAYGPEHLTDAWACRYVTLFQIDIPPLVDKLLRLIRHEVVDGTSSPFEKDGLEEMIIYTNRPANDPLAITSRVEQLLHASGLIENLSEENRRRIVRPPENKKSGYSSVHMIVRVPVEYEPFNGKSREQVSVAKIEIQLRDIFEEGWGEIQHRLIYSDKDVVGGKDEAADEQNWWKAHLNALKAFADGCSQHASIIKENSLTILPAKPPADSQPVSPPEADRALIIAALPSPPPADAEKRIRAAYADLLKLQNSGRKPSSFESSTVATAFRNAIEAASAVLDRSTGNGRTIGYYLRMEYAVALQNSEDRGVPPAVFRLFECVSAESPEDAAVYYRHSRAFTRIAKAHADWQQALDLLFRAEHAMLSDRTVAENASFRIAIPIQIGFVRWAIFDLLKTGGDEVLQQKSMLDLAIKETMRAKEIAESLIARFGSIHYIERYSFAIANLLYYYYEREILEYGDPQSVRAAGPHWNHGEVRSLLTILESPPVADIASKDINTRDTIMCVQYVLGEDEKAMDLAVLNMDELTNRARERSGQRNLSVLRIKQFLVNATELAIYQKALDISDWVVQHRP